VSSAIVILLTLTVVTLYFRWWKSVLVLLLPLGMATLYAFAVVTLPADRHPWSELEYARFGSVIVGNGVNSALFCWRGTWKSGASASRGSLARGRDLGLAQRYVVAALAAATAYGSLMLTQFRGFHQFGSDRRGGHGGVLAMAFLLSPSLVAWLDRDGSSRKSGAHRR